MPDALLATGLRTPFGRHGGDLATARPDDLAALVLRTLLARTGVPPERVDEVVLGCANQAGEDNRNVARMAGLLAGLPSSVPGITVNRLCGSGMSAIALASSMVRAGEADVVVAGGVESMTRAPWVTAKPERAWAKPGEVADSALGWRFVNPQMRALDGGQATMPLGETAEEVATLDGITREDCDAFALRSHENAVRAWKDGLYADEVVPVETKAGLVQEDQGPRPDSSLVRLAGLEPAFRKEGVVTAGNSSSLNDGAAVVLVVSEAAAAEFGLDVRARVVAATAAGVEPHLMGLGPVPATERLLARAGWSVDDVDVWEFNEAFAAQALACQRRLGVDGDKVNRDGGAIALGHPLGASGARITSAAASRLRREGARRAVASMCVGVGQGVSIALEAL